LGFIYGVLFIMLNGSDIGTVAQLKATVASPIPQIRAMGLKAAVIPTKSYMESIYKSVIPEFLYKPPFGYPRGVDIPELRRLASVPYCETAITAIIDEVSSIDWEIVPKDGKGGLDKIISNATGFFENPNVNDENFDFQLRMLLRDILVINSGIWNKVFSKGKKLVELYVRDGGTFVKNPDIFGTMRNKDGIIPIQVFKEVREGVFTRNMQNYIREKAAYFQYSWGAGALPIPFGTQEIVWIQKNPLPENIYGRSAISTLTTVLQALIYAIEHHKEQFTEDVVPKGYIKMLGASSDEIQDFSNAWLEQMRVKDSAGTWRKNFYNLPIVGHDGEFVRIGWSNEELQLITQQEWFAKLVWSCIGITPSELGYTMDSNRATEVVQSRVGRRRTIKPMLKILQHSINSNILWTDFSDKIEFRFKLEDLDEDIQRQTLYQLMLANGVKTINEIRAENGDKPLEGGDEPFANLNKQQPQALLSWNQDQDKIYGEKVGEQESAEETAKDKTDENKPEGEKETKAMTTADEMVMKPFEVIESSVKKKLKVYVTDILNLLENSKSRPLDGLKAMTKPQIEKALKEIPIEDLREIITKAIRESYYDGMDEVAAKFGKNFTIDPEVLSFIEEHSLDNVRDLTVEMRNDLRQMLERGMMDGHSNTKLKKEIAKILKKGIGRAEMIARTETMRAENMGTLEGYKKSGVSGKKQWMSTDDSLTCPICRRLQGQVKQLDKPFSDSVSQKMAMTPPIHPSCRCTVLFKPD